MATIECDNCGLVFDVEENTQCPKCKHPLVRFTAALKENGLEIINRLAVLPDGGIDVMRHNTPWSPIFKEVNFEKDVNIKVEYVINQKNKYNKEHPYPDSVI